MMKLKKRESNYELLRIISMLMIVMTHVIVHGRVEANSNGLILLIIKFIEAILVVHVNSFILVTGYYQCKTDFKFKKLVALNNATWFYRAGIALVLLFLNITTLSKIDIIRNLFPIDLSFYWFIDAYLLLYCFSPFLNILIKKLDKSTFRKLLLTCFIIISVLPNFTRGQAFYNANGLSLYNFIFLYFVGAYFRYNKVEIWNYFKINSLKKIRLIYASAFVLLLIFNFSLFVVGRNLLDLGHIANYVGLTIVNATLSFDNPLVILGSLMYFLWFGCLVIDSKFINKISTLVFGVYLIHDNPHVKGLIYKWFGFGDGMIVTYKVFPKIIIVTLIIFVSCLIIECIRQILFKLISKLWISKKIRNRWYTYLDELKSN
jgi:surface polysaccharide O-acyltransferase-like enzyme